MASSPSAATLKRRRRAAAKLLVEASETEEDAVHDASPYADKHPVRQLSMNKATGRYECVPAPDLEEPESDEEDTRAEDTRPPIPISFRMLARDVADVAHRAKDLTLGAKLISPFAGSLMQLWTHAEWQVHRSRWRFWWHCKRWFLSTVLRRIRIPLMVLLLYSCLIRLLNEQLGGILSVPLAALTLQGASIGLLLVFRTNSASARVSEARGCWGALNRHCVTIADVLRCHADISQHVDAVAEVGRLLASLGFILKGGLRQGEATMPKGAGGAHDFVRVLLGGDELVEWVLHGAATRSSHKNKAKTGIAPYRRALLRIRQILGALPLDQVSKNCSTFPSSPEAATALAEHLDGLATVGGSCFKQLTTPIPPTYQRHVERGMLIWLAALPLALPRDLGQWPVLFSVASTAYLVLGIDEIAVQHEEAFSVLPLHEISVSNARGVATSLASRPPALPASLRANVKGDM